MDCVILGNKGSPSLKLRDVKAKAVKKPKSQTLAMFIASDSSDFKAPYNMCSAQT